MRCRLLWKTIGILATVFFSLYFFGVFVVSFAMNFCYGIEPVRPANWFSWITMSAECGCGGFRIDNNLAIVEGVVTIRNNTNEDKSVYMKALMPFDYIYGFASTPLLPAVNMQGEPEVFLIPAGEEVKFDTVRFQAPAGYGKHRVDRLTPWLVFEPANRLKDTESSAKGTGTHPDLGLATPRL